MNLIDYQIVTGPEALEVVSQMVTAGRLKDAAGEAVDVFLQFLNRYGIDVSRQAVAKINGRIAGYCLCLVNPGATGHVFLPETFEGLDSRHSYSEIATNVLKLLVSQIEHWDLALLQTMVHREQSPSADIFHQAGFSTLCHLNLLQTMVANQQSVAENAQVGWVGYDSTRTDQFIRLILQTYQDSRDCPVLTGLRTGREILQGHQGSGIFEPQAWQILRYQDRDAGVILLNNTEESPHRLELIYMGLAPWARGKSLGDLLLNQAFLIAKKLGKKVIRLSVDRENAPAIKLYQKFGFRLIGHQTVLAVANEKRRERLKKHPEE